MSYISKNNITYLSDILILGYLKNENGNSTNPTLSISISLDLNTNKLTELKYCVKCFDNKDILGYFREEFNTYEEAKIAYNKVYEGHPIGRP